jgi:hypothetical protein
MRTDNCWCRRSSPVRFIEEKESKRIWECLQCHGIITAYLSPGEVWEERSSNDLKEDLHEE